MKIWNVFWAGATAGSRFWAKVFVKSPPIHQSLIA